MNRFFLNFFLSIGILTTFFLQPSKVEAIFASVKATGMAAACISYPLDTLVGAYNPAGMSDIGNRFDLEAAWVQDWGSAAIRNNVLDYGRLNKVYDGMRTKYVFPVGFGLNKIWCLNDEWQIATGIVLYNRNYQKTTYKHAVPLFGTTPLGLEYLNETVSPMISIQWCGSHSLGISANYQVERIKVNGLQNFDLPYVSIAPGHVTNRGYDYSTGWGFTVGYLGHITDCLSIGITYQPETSMSRMNKYKGFLAHKGKLNIPRKIGAGISYLITPCFAIAFDVEQIHWKPVKALSNPLLHKGMLEELGSANGPGFGFKDQWYYRLGIEWEVDECWTIRAGYRHANSPIRDSQAAINMLTLDAVEDFITVGATWNYNENNEISFVFAYGFENEIHGKEAIPAEFGGGDVHLKEQKYAVGLAWGYQF